MEYSFRDIYPTMGYTETSTEAIPTPVEQNALQEDATTAEKANPKFASGRNILLGVVVLACAVVFLGSMK
jgi:hypothetical protein